MKRDLLCFILLSIILFSCNNQHREELLFNNNWDFAIVPDADSTLYINSEVVDSSWERVSLPHNPHPEPMYVTNQWQGICWYRKNFDIENYSKDRNYFLKFEAAMNFSQVWVNGVLLSEHNGGYLPIVIDISSVAKASDNIVAVRLDNRDNAITGPKPMKINGFQMYGGLYRNAWLYSTNKIYISDANSADIDVAGGGIFITYSKVAEELSIVDVKTNIVNSSSTPATIKVVESIYDGNNLVTTNSSSQSVEAKSRTVNSSSLSVTSAKLWSPSTPNLYRLKTTILQGVDTLDVKITRFGIRSFEFEGNDLYINGVKSFLRGVNRHQEYPFVGYALSDLAQYRDAQIIKDGGFDYIRLCHYPHSDAFMDACDSLGIVVIDAIMGWQYYDKSDAFQQHAFHSVRQLIRRDRNHPSVLAWEASLNETYMPTPFMERLHQIVHEESPYMGTYSCGWRFAPYDIYLQARQHRIIHPQEVVFDKPYSVSEYGDWEYYSDKQGFNQHTYSNSKRLEMCSRQHRSDGEVRMLQQARNVQEAHNDNLSIPAYSDSYWAMFDYNIGVSPIVDAPGLMNILRLPKFAYYFYASQREFSPQNAQLTIASYWDKDSSTDVRVFSNCDSVELVLNGRSLAIQAPDRDRYSTHLQHPPFTFHVGEFTPGTLLAIGYKDGARVKECRVSTPGKPAAIECLVDTHGYDAKAGCNDLLFIHARVVDAAGTLCHTYNSDITFTLSPNLELMNTDGVKVEAGIATALVRVGDASGESSISASSVDGLNGTTKFNVI